MDTYSTYEAKARFSEILRKVRAGRRIVVTHHGARVAEIRPIDATPATLGDRLADLERAGVVAPRRARVGGSVGVVVRRRGALARFLASRD